MLLSFLSKFCFIQNLIKWKVIGLGEEKGGLYFLQNQASTPDFALPTTINKSVSFHSTNIDLDLWHYRLDHPSFTTFKFLKD